MVRAKCRARGVRGVDVNAVQWRVGSGTVEEQCGGCARAQVAAARKAVAAAPGRRRSGAGARGWRRMGLRAGGDRADSARRRTATAADGDSGGERTADGGGV
jgi:hypothetical protein